MTLKCARCQKPMKAAYVSDGPFSWGPKCAKAAGFTRPTGPRFKAAEAQPEIDSRQLALPMEPVRPVIQGHRYKLDGVDVLAMESGHDVTVADIGGQWLTNHRRASAEHMTPQPMAYFHGQIPQ